MPLTLYEELPDVNCKTTHGELSLHTYLGDSWGLVFSHPGDFTPVCTTEIASMAKMEKSFLVNNCKMIALSCDSLEDHAVWIRDVETVAEAVVSFPIIADPARSVSKALKMDYDRLLGDDSKPLTARVGYIVSPKKEVVYISIVPWTVGRSFTEFLRALKALQLTFYHPVATPAEWVPGDKVFLTDKGKAIPEYNTMTQSCPGLPSRRDYITLIDDPQAAKADVSERAATSGITMIGGGKTVITETEAGAKAAASGEGKSPY